MPKNETPADLNQIVARGIAASLKTAIADARRYNVPLIVWRNGEIVELSPESLELEERPLE